jgi:protein-S-isoprenylcysteine O-methyltransferase Ste14
MVPRALSLATRALVQLALLFAVLGLVLFLPAGTLRFWQAWAYLGIFVVASAAVTAYLMRKDPGLLERRLALAEKGEQERKQKIIQALAGPSFFGMLVVAGVDRRLGWSPHLPPAVVIVADTLVAAGFVIVFLVFRENSFTSAIVEVSKEQKVITTGPYRFVRHPMYSGGLLLIVATPFALGSVWAAVLVVPLFVAIVVRLLDEERFLAAHLTGYAEYLRATRHRLLPHVW